MRPAQPCGLDDEEAGRRLREQGPNELPTSKPRSVLRLLRDIVFEPMFLLLVACGAIYMVLGDRQEASMLLGFVFVVMGITFVQERRTEHSLDALRDLSSPRALVLRGDQARRIPGRELVRGDVVLLAEGDRVPADIRLHESSNLMVDESMLTGESVPVAKRAASDSAAPDDNANVNVFSGTLVTQGTARGEVVATGEQSALGRIGRSLAGLGGNSTPIQAETRHIVKVVALAGMALAALLTLGYGILRAEWLHALLAGLTLAMAIIPEELPVVLTLFLGLGAWRLSRQSVLARNIPAVELLGATTVLCVDKTGTLTTNHMVVRKLWCDGTEFDVGGALDALFPETFHGLLEYAVLASHRRAFDPMETAITEAGKTLLADTEHLHGDWTLVDDYPLSREMLAMTRVWQSPDTTERMIAAKGAPEAMVDLCHLDPVRGARIADQVARMAADGLRVIGVARAVFAARDLPESQHDFDFQFLGLVGLEDPVRANVPDAIAECRAAGIRVVMITGDHPATALSIARQAGLPANGNFMTGAELASLGDDELGMRLAATDIFCRVMPEHKLRLVQAFRASGEVVAMTGDGVNDAPALKAANIGVAMGARGTDVAREAAGLVLLEDDFSSLVTAVRYGRRIFSNLRKAIVFVVAVHVPIVGLSILPVMLGWPLVLLPAHILFLQLIIDPSCSLVFEAEEPERDAMRGKPRRPEDRLFDTAVLIRGLWQGAGLLALLCGMYAWSRHHTGSDDAARAMTFTVLVLSNIGLIYVNRTWEGATWQREHAGNRYFNWMAVSTLAVLTIVLTIPAIARLFSFVRPPAGILPIAAGAAIVATLWFEVVKTVLRKRQGGTAPAG
ncbi:MULTISPECIES: cation-translocating P-type ATPase [unclassified Massilia]|jgi:Ca2+-transporting ATPase|uniref:cation-translocating P-type ATPase n=1 Tax=unclassified Massilia TaxID=2609279 RepID=UPI000AD0576A|nr:MULTISPECIES: cation-translocating P-type ATPase [unclassified Massilia]